MQDQTSIPDDHRSPGLEYAAAEQVAESYEAVEVGVLPSVSGRLVGTKESVFVKVDSSGTVSVDNNYVRDSEWTRLFR